MVGKPFQTLKVATSTVEQEVNMKRIMQLEAQVEALVQDKERNQTKPEDSDNLQDFKTPVNFALKGLEKEYTPRATDEGSPVSNPFQLIRIKSPSGRLEELKKLFQSLEGGSTVQMEVDKPTTSKSLGGISDFKPQEGGADSETVLNIAHAVQKEAMGKDSLLTDPNPGDKL